VRYKGEYWCVVVFTHHPSFSHLTLIMPRPAGGAKKRPVAKALALKEAAAKEALVKLSARRAIPAASLITQSLSAIMQSVTSSALPSSPQPHGAMLSDVQQRSLRATWAHVQRQCDMGPPTHHSVAMTVIANWIANWMHVTRGKENCPVMAAPASVSSTSAASGMHVTRGKEDCPVMAAPASVSSTSATSVRHMHTGAQPAVPALSRGMPAYYHHLPLTALAASTPAVADDLSPVATDIDPTYPTPEDRDAEMVILCGE
jgi:hypothetical protein